MDAQEALESLTVGGSEFSSDPDACAEYVRGRITSLEDNVKRLVRQRNEITKKLYHLYDLLAGVSALLELAAEMAQTAPRCADCPMREKGCPAFWEKMGGRSTWPCNTVPARLRELAQALRVAGVGASRE